MEVKVIKPNKMEILKKIPAASEDGGSDVEKKSESDEYSGGESESRDEEEQGE